MALAAMLHIMKVKVGYDTLESLDKALILGVKWFMPDQIINIVIPFIGQPYLWARLDRKPTKLADKSFKKYQHSHKSSKGIRRVL